MAEKRQGAWFGFGFCGFGQALGSGNGQHAVHSPEPLHAADDVCQVSASWSYTALVTREYPYNPNSGPVPSTCPALLNLPVHPYSGNLEPMACVPSHSTHTGGGRVQLSGSVSCAADGCRDAWASEGLLVLQRNKSGSGTELQAWVPGSALQGEPLWVQNLASGAKTQGEDEPGSEPRMGTLPLLPCARAYVIPQPPFCQPLAPELRVRQLQLGAEHVLLLCEAGQVFSWGGGR